MGATLDESELGDATDWLLLLLIDELVTSVALLPSLMLGELLPLEGVNVDDEAPAVVDSDVGSTELCTPSEELLMALDEAGVFELPWLGVEVP